jgi:hypothetical protein
VGEGGGGVHGTGTLEEEEVVLGRHGEEEEGRIGRVAAGPIGSKVKENLFSE